MANLTNEPQTGRVHFNAYLERSQVETIHRMAREQDRSASYVLRTLLTQHLPPAATATAHVKQSQR